MAELPTLRLLEEDREKLKEARESGSLLETGEVLPAEPWQMAPVRGARAHADA